MAEFDLTEFDLTEFVQRMTDELIENYTAREQNEAVKLIKEALIKHRIEEIDRSKQALTELKRLR